MTIKYAVINKNFKEFKLLIKKSPISKIAKSLEEEVDLKKLIDFFKDFRDNDISYQIISSMSYKSQSIILNNIGDESFKLIINNYHSDKLADIIEKNDHSFKYRVIKALDNEENKKVVQKILRYHEDQVGSIMCVDIVVLKQSMSTSEALNHIKQERKDKRLTHNFFIVNSKDKLIGYINLEDLVYSDPYRQIKKLSKPITSEIKTTTNKEMAAEIFSKSNMSSLPVIDTSGRVLGAIFSDDIIDIIKEEVEEDIKRLVGIDGSDLTPYMKKGVFKMFKERILWLVILMFTLTLVSALLQLFKDTANREIGEHMSTAIVVMLPVVMNTAGNAGNQTSTIITRSLSTGEVTTRMYWKVVKKELLTSLLIGLGLALVNTIRLVIYYSISGDISDLDHIYLLLASSISVILVIVLAKFIGLTIPLVSKMFKMDPAILSGPLVATIMDMVSTVTLFSISIGIITLFNLF